MASIISRIAPRVVGSASGRKIVASPFPGAMRRAAPAASVSRAAAIAAMQGQGARPIQPTYPICLFADVDVASGAEVAVRSQALTNRTGKPLEIREIRFSAIAVAAAAVNFVFMDLGGIIAASLEVDGKPITNSYVPIWSLSKTEDYNAQLATETSGTLYGPWAQYVWRLSRPWYLQPGAQITAQFRHSGAMKYGATAGIGLVGRTAEKAQTTSAVPYACSWTSQPLQDTSTGLEESIETDLLNVTKRIVTVDRIVGRVSSRYTTAVGPNNFLIYNDVTAWNGEFGGLDLKVFTSDHRPITRDDFLGVDETFGPRRAIEVVHPFLPGDFYRASLRKAASFSSNANDYYAQAYVSVLGWREEPVR